MSITSDQWNAIWNNGYQTGWNDRYHTSHAVAPAPSAVALNISASDWNAVWTAGFDAAYGQHVSAPAPGAIPNLPPPSPPPPPSGSGGPGAGTAGGPYTYAQVEGFWVNAGGPPEAAAIMAAIATAESGRTNVIQSGQPYATTGWGLWQITPGNSEPQVGIDYALLNPETNARAAVAKYRSGGLNQWTTYTSGAWRQYYQGGTPPATGPSGGGGGAPTPATPNVTDAIKSLNWAGDFELLWQAVAAGTETAKNATGAYRQRFDGFDYVGANIFYRP
jgi:hypothetical protein